MGEHRGLLVSVEAQRSKGPTFEPTLFPYFFQGWMTASQFQQIGCIDGRQACKTRKNGTGAGSTWKKGREGLKHAWSTDLIKTMVRIVELGLFAKHARIHPSS